MRVKAVEHEMKCGCGAVLIITPQDVKENDVGLFRGDCYVTCCVCNLNFYLSYNQLPKGFQK